MGGMACGAGRRAGASAARAISMGSIRWVKAPDDVLRVELTWGARLHGGAAATTTTLCADLPDESRSDRHGLCQAWCPGPRENRGNSGLNQKGGACGKSSQ